MATFAPGDAVQTPFGKGVVREVRNHGQLLVQIQQRAMLVPAAQASRVAAPAKARPDARAPASGSHEAFTRAGPHEPAEVDLHGLTVDEALERIDAALDSALRAGAGELRFIHGRSGGKLRGALHRRLHAISAVRGVRLDPRNPGATIVTL